MRTHRQSFQVTSNGPDAWRVMRYNDDRPAFCRLRKLFFNVPDGLLIAFKNFGASEVLVSNLLNVYAAQKCTLVHWSVQIEICPQGSSDEFHATDLDGLVVENNDVRSARRIAQSVDQIHPVVNRIVPFVIAGSINDGHVELRTSPIYPDSINADVACKGNDIGVQVTLKRNDPVFEVKV